jgi:hypothetical protein
MEFQTPFEAGPLLDLLRQWVDLMQDGEYAAAWSRAMGAGAVALSLAGWVGRQHGTAETESGNLERSAEGLREFLCAVSTACERAEVDG